MASSERDQPLAGAFYAIMDKTEADILDRQRSRIENELSCIKDSFSERFQLSMLVLHQSTCTRKDGL